MVVDNERLSWVSDLTVAIFFKTSSSNIYIRSLLSFIIILTPHTPPKNQETCTEGVASASLIGTSFWAVSRVQCAP